MQMRERFDNRCINHCLGTLFMLHLLQSIDAFRLDDDALAPKYSDEGASAVQMKNLKHQKTANGIRVSITFRGNPNQRGIEKLQAVSTNGWRFATSSSKPKSVKTERTFDFLIPKEHQNKVYTIVFGKQAQTFVINGTGIRHMDRLLGYINFLREKIRLLTPDPFQPEISRQIDSLNDKTVNLKKVQMEHQQSIGNLRGELNRVEKEMGMKVEKTTSPKELKAVEENLKSQLGALEEKIDEKASELSGDVARTKAELVGRIDKVVAAAKKERDDLEAKIERLQGEHGKHKEALGKLQSRVVNLEENIAELLKLNSTIFAHYEAFDKKTKANKASIDRNMASNGEKFVAIDNRIKKVTEKQKGNAESLQRSIDSSVKGAGENVAQAKRELERKLSQSIRKAETARDGLTKEIKRLEKEFGVPHKGELKMLRKDVETLKESIADMTALNATVFEHHDNFVKIIQQNKALIDAQIALSEERFQKVFKQLADLKLDKESAKLRGDLDKFNKKVETDMKIVKNEMEAVEAEVGKIKGLNSTIYRHHGVQTKGMDDLEKKVEGVRDTCENKYAKLEARVTSVRADLQSDVSEAETKAEANTKYLDGMKIDLDLLNNLKIYFMEDLSP